jgi:hypothetical protein
VRLLLVVRSNSDVAGSPAEFYSRFELGLPSAATGSLRQLWLA